MTLSGLQTVFFTCRYDVCELSKQRGFLRHLPSHEQNIFQLAINKVTNRWKCIDTPLTCPLQCLSKRLRYYIINKMQVFSSQSTILYGQPTKHTSAHLPIQSTFSQSPLSRFPILRTGINPFPLWCSLCGWSSAVSDRAGYLNRPRLPGGEQMQVETQRPLLASADRPTARLISG